MNATTTIKTFDDPITALKKHPRTVALAVDLRRLEKEERQNIDRNKQDELARLRAVAAYD